MYPATGGAGHNLDFTANSVAYQIEIDRYIYVAIPSYFFDKFGDKSNTVLLKLSVSKNRQMLANVVGSMCVLGILHTLLLYS